MQEENNMEIVSTIGPVEVDWPKSLGYFGGIALAVAFDLIEPPLAIVIAAIPFIKMLDRPRSPLPVKMISEFATGASKPIGGDAEATIRFTTQGIPGQDTLH